MKREVREETGLDVTSCRFLFAFDEPIARTLVFEIQAAGELKGSWEDCSVNEPVSMFRPR